MSARSKGPGGDGAGSGGASPPAPSTGGDADGRQHELLDRYRSELVRWGARINLVGSTDREALDRHIADSLAAAGALAAGARVVDLGTGAGFPGLPLAVARPDVAFVLLEIREARVHFLRHVVRTLGLACEVRRGRIEEPERGGFDLALARAVGPLADVIRGGRPWLREGGEIWIWSREAPEACGVDGVRTIPIPAPAGARGQILRVPGHAIPRGTHPD